MTRRCTVCAHDDRDVIDAAIVGSAAYRRLATLYELNEASVRRHASTHLPATLAAASRAGEITRANSLLTQIEDLQVQALDLLAEARETGDLRAGIAAVGQARGVLELLARLEGQLTESSINVVVSAEWIELRTLVLRQLEPWPEARSALADALQGAEK